MNWLFIAFTSYLLLALVNIADKFLLSNVIKDDRVYIFFIGALGLLVFGAVPFLDFHYPGHMGFGIDLIAGVMLIAALFLFYKALRTGETSIVVPLIGGGTPVIVFIISFFLLEQSFTTTQLIAVVFLIIGGVLMTLIPKENLHPWQFWKNKKESKIGFAFLSTFLFALYFLLSEYSYTTQGFEVGFIWTRIGSFIAVVWLLLSRSFQKSLTNFFKGFFRKKNYIYFINQFFGSIGFAGQGLAISIQGAAIVNALQGVQYIFLLIFASVISLVFPKLINERISKLIIIEKTLAVLVIGIGVYLIVH